MGCELMDKSLNLVNRCFTGLLGTVDENGIPQIKALIKSKSDGLKEFWFCSNTDSKRVRQIKNNPNSSLYFYDEKTFEGLLLTGKSEISYDNNMRREFWNDSMKLYYPLGYTDPDFALIKFTSTRCNYYHGLKNIDFNITMNIIEQFLKLDINTESLGLIPIRENYSYFCTPKNAIVFANIGVDGIHFCLVPKAEDETLENSPIYVISPMGIDDHYTEPIARSFKEFLNMAIILKDAGALECISYTNKEAFLKYIEEIQQYSEDIEYINKRTLAIDELRQSFNLEENWTPEEIYDSVKLIQKDKSLRILEFTQEALVQNEEVEILSSSTVIIRL